MPPQTDARLNAALALTRFGLGAKAGEIDKVASDPRGWLDQQIQPEGAPNPSGRFDTTTGRVRALLDYQRDLQGVRTTQRAGASMSAPQPMAEMSGTAASLPEGGTPSAPELGDPDAQAALAARRESRQSLARETAAEFLARAQLGAETEAGFAERWALFWANTFTVSATKFQAAVFVGPYEREAIRPHVFGQFDDLAVAATTHPAMLLYLDQVQSIGPNSRAGSRRGAGLNENLAREIMELHTVGADSSYSQADVTEFARALTGWSIPTNRDARARLSPAAIVDGQSAFVFRALVHEPGARSVLGKRYEEGGAEQGEAILRDLANRPETAKRLARKIAQHFVADDPPASLVARLESAWIASRGDLSQVAKALITSSEAWGPQPVKIKTPYEFIVSAHRALGTRPVRLQPLQQSLVQMGQPAFSAPSPEGWPDTAADWAGPDALVKRLNWATTVGEAAQNMDPVAVATGALGPRLTERSRLAVARAGSRSEALTLFLMSPEFQRR